MKIAWLPILLLSNPVFAGTCALCRKALESGGKAGLLEGFYWSILLIGSIPLLVIGFGVGYARRFWKK